jgi:hypothetical protein
LGCKEITARAAVPAGHLPEIPYLVFEYPDKPELKIKD